MWIRQPRMNTTPANEEGQVIEEHHEERSRNWVFPYALIQLYKDRTINAEDVFLLGIINALQDPEQGCYASNRWLGKWWKKHPVHVSRTLARFAELGLVRIKLDTTNKRRTIRHIWVTFQVDSLPVTLNKNVKGVHNKNVKQYSNTSYYKKKNNCRVKDSLRSSTLHATDGFFDSGEAVDPFIKQSCLKLEDYIRQSRRLNGRRVNQKKWHKEMTLLLQDIEGDKLRLQRVLKTYLTEPHTKFTPQAECAASFRAKFSRIEAWANEFDPPSEKPTIIVRYKKDDGKVWADEEA